MNKTVQYIICSVEKCMQKLVNILGPIRQYFSIVARFSVSVMSTQRLTVRYPSFFSSALCAEDLRRVFRRFVVLEQKPKIAKNRQN